LLNNVKSIAVFVPLLHKGLIEPLDILTNEFINSEICNNTKQKYDLIYKYINEIHRTTETEEFKNFLKEKLIQQ